MKTQTYILTLMIVLLSASLGWAQEEETRKDANEPNVMSALKKMRIRQEYEERRVLRVIQTPVSPNQKPVCSPIQQSRQRLRDLGRGKDYGMGQDVNGVLIDAGHDNLSIEGNEGQINNNVNLNVEAPDEDRCL